MSGITDLGDCACDCNGCKDWDASFFEDSRQDYKRRERLEFQTWCENDSLVILRTQSLLRVYLALNLLTPAPPKYQVLEWQQDFPNRLNFGVTAIATLREIYRSFNFLIEMQGLRDSMYNPTMIYFNKPLQLVFNRDFTSTMDVIQMLSIHVMQTIYENDSQLDMRRLRLLYTNLINPERDVPIESYNVHGISLPNS